MKDKLLEEWKPIKEYEELYEVSSFGRIRSLDKIIKTHNRFGNMNKKIKGKIIKEVINKKTGYSQIILSKEKNKKMFLIHRLVLENFIPNPENKPQVNHIDGNKQNNNLNNLEWCTRSGNIKHSFKTGLSHSNFKTQSGKKHHFYGKHHNENAKKKMKLSHYKKVIQFDKNNNFIKEWNGIKEVEEVLKISNGNISECCKGNRKTAGGYIWRYANER